MAGNVAALVEGWKRQAGGSFAGVTGASGPTEVSYPTVELFLSEQWVDITSFVYYRDMINITRGKRDEASSLDPSSCTFTINNRDGRFSPRNPTGPYYGVLGRNTPVRVSIVRNGVRLYRFYGEISSWPSKWDISGTDIYVEVEAAGILRRLSQGNSPLRSALFREMTSPSRTNIVSYWPCEDNEGSTTVASGLGQHSMTVTGTPTFASYTGFAGSDALPVMGSASTSVDVPAYVHLDGEHVIRFYMGVGASGLTSTQTLADISTGASNVRSWKISMNTTNQIRLQATFGSTSVLDTGFSSYSINDGDIVAVILELSVSPAFILSWRITVENYTGVPFLGTSIPAVTFDGTFASTLNQIDRIIIGGDLALGDTAIGHISVANDVDAYTNTGSATRGWRGENPSDRISRLCREENIAYQSVTNGTTGNTVTMGTQKQDSLVNLLSEVPATDLGRVYEPRDELGLRYRNRLSLDNQSARLTLDYSQNQLSGSLNPVDDDRFTRNDVTVTRVDGSSFEKTQDTGTLSTQAPPNGVGRYDESVSISLRDDSLLSDQAGWRLHLGTVDEARYPEISLNLRHSTFTSSISMMNAVLALDVGDRLVVSNPPAWLPPDQITQLVEGYTETLGILEHDIIVNCTPESGHQIPVLDLAVFSHLDTSGSVLTSAVSSTATSIRITTTDGQVWTQSHQDTPFDLAMSGEVVSVVSNGTTINANALLLASATGWNASSSTISYDTGVVNSDYGAAASILVVPDGVTASGGVNSDHSAVGTITAAASYTVVGWVFSPAGWADLRTAVDWYDASDVFISSSLGSATSVAAGTWTFLSQTFTAPALSSIAVTRGRWGSTPAATDTSYWWGIRLIADSTVLSTSPQDFTVVRSVNGVVKAQAASTDISLANPVYIAF